MMTIFKKVMDALNEPCSFWIGRIIIQPDTSIENKGTNTWEDLKKTFNH